MNEDDAQMIEDIHKIFNVRKYDKMFSFNLNDWLLQIFYRLEIKFLINMDKYNKTKDFDDEIIKRMRHIFNTPILNFKDSSSAIPFSNKKPKDFNVSSVKELCNTDNSSAWMLLTHINEDLLIEAKDSIINTLIEEKPLIIDMSHSDEKIKHDFSEWLKKRREELIIRDSTPSERELDLKKEYGADYKTKRPSKTHFKKRTAELQKDPTPSNLQNWAHNLILPYYDLQLLFEYQNDELLSSVAAKLLFKPKGDLRNKNHIKQTIKPLTDIIFKIQHYNYLVSLNLNKVDKI